MKTNNEMMTVREMRRKLFEIDDQDGTRVCLLVYPRIAGGEDLIVKTTVREARQRLFDIEDQDGTRVRFQICPPAANRGA